MTTITLILSLLLTALDGATSSTEPATGTSSEISSQQRGTNFIITEEGMP